MIGKELDVLRQVEASVCIDRIAKIEQATLLCLGLPFIRIAVAVKNDTRVRLEGILEQFGKRLIKIRCLLQHIGKLTEALGNRGVQHDVGHGNILRRANHTELELVARKGKGRGAVSVSRILAEGRQRRNAKVHNAGLCILAALTVNDRVDDLGDVLADKDRNDRRGCFALTQAVIVACVRNRDAKQILIIVHRLDDSGKDQEELDVLGRGLAGIKQIFASIGAKRPVVMLTRAVYTGIGLFVK